uniref:protein O-glucosyltransferase 2-like n=1 Tax=Styela clava TaxID=7725 RepID=UPI00193AB7BD|nr:protein O-glucosyltransferase 2-like [Styela clava]
MLRRGSTILNNGLWVVLLSLACSVFRCCLSAKVDLSKTIVSGPGIVDDATLPVRYVYIHPHDSKGKPITKDLGDGAFSLTVTKNGQNIRAWRQVLNLHNGTYIARFRLYDFGGDIEMSLKYQSKHVAKSPYKLINVYGDECYCPMPLKKWTEALKCPATFDQVERDLEIFEKIDLDDLVKKGIPKFGVHHSFCHYVVRSNKIYRQCHGKYTDFKMFMDATLLSLTKKLKLPDVEFLINLGDWPLERGSKEQAHPIFSWCGSDKTLDIVLPTYDITQSVFEMLGRVSLDIFSVQANTGPNWEKKSNKGFFRGRDSRQERLDLAAMSLANPDLLDVAITNYFFFKQDEEKYGKKVKHVSFFEFFKHKYQLNVDGTVAAYRLPYLLVGDGLVFKQESEYYEHFYKDLKPWVHFVPLKRDLSDVIEKIKWAREHDDEARKIQQAATKLAREILTPDRILCYYVVAFNEYAKRQTRPVKVLKKMEMVKQPDKKCSCHRKKAKPKSKKEEL